MAILAGRSLEGFELLQVPLSHDLGEEAVGLADPGLQRLDPGFGAVCLGVDRCHTRMLAELGGPDPFEAEQVELEGGPAQLPVERLDGLQDALWAMEVPSTHGAGEPGALGSGHNPPAIQASSG